jgi:beta-lactamase class A
VRSRTPFSALRWLSLFFILAGVILFTLQLVRFSRVWANFPSGLTMAGIPVGHLNRQEAAERLRSVYSLPVELHYGEAVIQLPPSTVGFELDIDNMLAAAELERTRIPFWEAFWNYLWGQPGTTTDIPMRISYSEERLRSYLRDEISARYDEPPSPATPVVGTVNFRPGTMGTEVDIDRSVLLIDAALRSSNQRSVVLPLQRAMPGRPALQNLEILLRQTIDIAGFDGLISIYLLDLQNGQDLHFVYQQEQALPTQPDAPFSASSTIKIPIMISTFRRIDLDNAPDAPETVEALRLMEEMIVRSGNPPADQLMGTYLDATRGPLLVTEDMRQLGLENTLMAGYFYVGAPLLQRIDTPANQRGDLIVSLDPYSQTTSTEMGMLLSDIYQCAREGGGSLMAIFPGEITQAECQAMVQFLLKNHIAVLIQAGVADGTPVAHKHGWVQDQFGVIRDVSDAALVYTPGGNYVLTIFLYHPVQIIWDTTSKMVADLSKAVYNFYNLPSP